MKTLPWLVAGGTLGVTLYLLINRTPDSVDHSASLEDILTTPGEAPVSAPAPMARTSPVRSRRATVVPVVASARARVKPAKAPAKAKKH